MKNGKIYYYYFEKWGAEKKFQTSQGGKRKNKSLQQQNERSESETKIFLGIWIPERQRKSFGFWPAMASKQMEEIQRKLALLNYPRANAPAQSLLFAGVERYALLEWLFFKYLDFSSFLLHCHQFP